jgi:cytochrome c-type biogenesis protein CcmH/NrfF
MNQNASGAGSAAKGRLVGFVALGALLILVGVAFYSSQDASAPSATRTSPGPSEPVQLSQPSESPQTTPPPPADAVSVPIASKMPRVADSLAAKPAKGAIISTKLEDVALSPPARLLAERFKCVCGCPDMLAVCTCKKTPGSRDMKKYLQELVSAGKTPAEVESAMVARYGPKVLP